MKPASNLYKSYWNCMHVLIIKRVLSGRVLDSRSRDHGFKPHRHHCVVSLSKTHLSLFITSSTQESLSQLN